MKPSTTALALLPLLLAACAGTGGRPHGDAVTEAACRQRANSIYALRHPETRYLQDTYTSSLRDAPLSSSGSPSLPTRGLGDTYELQRLVDECLHGTGVTGPTPAAPPATVSPSTAPLAAPPPSP